MDSNYHKLVLGDSAEQYKDEEKVEGEIESLLRVVAARGMTLASEHQTRVKECSDLELIGQWITRAVTAAKPEDIFND